MKHRRGRNCTAVGIAACCAVFSLAAQAEGDITLYGLLDAGTTFTNNQFGKSGWKQSMSGDSYFGLRGKENLGEGFKAIFTLESAIDINDGKLKNTGKLFGNQALVGLASDQFGTVKVGRQTDSLVDNVAPLSLTGSTFGADKFAHPYDNDNLSNSFRVNNSVKYESPNLYGFKFDALYGFSGHPGNFASNRAYSVGASYQLDGLRVGAAYLQQNGNSSTWPNTSTKEGAIGPDNPLLADSRRTWAAGVNYTLGPATAGVVLSQTHLSGGDSISPEASGNRSGIGLGGKSADFKNVEANFRYALTQSLGIGGAYTYTLGDVAGRRQHWHQYNLETDYSLSKNTNLYLQGAYQRVSGADHAVISGMDASDTTTQLAASVGLRHAF